MNRVNEILGQGDINIEKVLDFLPYPFLVSEWRENNQHNLFVNKRFIEEIGYSCQDIPTITEWFEKAHPDPDSWAGYILPSLHLYMLFSLNSSWDPPAPSSMRMNPSKKNAMHLKPRPYSNTFFSWKEIRYSILQGLVITAGTLLTYRYAIHENLGEEKTRAMVFATLVSANIFLTIANRSFYYSLFTTARYHNPLMWLIIFITSLLSACMLYISSLAHFFKFSPPGLRQLGISITVGVLSVIWCEVTKLIRRQSIESS